LALVFDIVLGIGVALVLIGSILPAIDAASVAAGAASPTPGSYGYGSANAAGNNRAAAMGRTAIYLWVRLFGYLMVMTAAIMYMQPNETRTRRVTGAVLICGVVLLSFMMLAPNSALLWMQQMMR
jgi:hypothetical protein